MKIKIIRGAFLNPFELQNYYPIKSFHNIEVISSKFPISSNINFPIKKLYSPTDIPNFPFKYPLLNRIFIDAHLLYGLEGAIAGCDIAHVAETYYGYTYQATKAKKRGWVKKIVSTVWETISNNNQSLPGRAKIKKFCKENIDHFIAVTQIAKRALIEEGIAKEKITVIPFGVDIKKFTPSKSKKKKRNINILCVARLVPEKGVLDLLNAFLELKKTNKNLTLTFVGNGPLKSHLVGYKGVFVKKVNYNKMPAEYHKADIFCLASQSTKTWEEQFGMCLVEAMASGLPIVSTLTGAIPEVCGEVALLVKPNSLQELVIALEKLIYNKDIRQKMSISARRRAVDFFDSEKIAVKIQEVYEKLLCR